MRYRISCIPERGACKGISSQPYASLRERRDSEEERHTGAKCHNDTRFKHTIDGSRPMPRGPLESRARTRSRATGLPRCPVPGGRWPVADRRPGRSRTRHGGRHVGRPRTQRIRDLESGSREGIPPPFAEVGHSLSLRAAVPRAQRRARERRGGPESTYDGTAISRNGDPEQATPPGHWPLGR
jgi:hypothetical protein